MRRTTFFLAGFLALLLGLIAPHAAEPQPRALPPALQPPAAQAAPQPPAAQAAPQPPAAQAAPQPPAAQAAPQPPAAQAAPQPPAAQAAPQPPAAQAAPQPPAAQAAPQTVVIPFEPVPAGAMDGSGGGAPRVAVPLPPPPPPPRLSLGPSDVAQDNVVHLALNKARPVDLPVDVRDVVVGNPDIADVMLRSPRQIYIMAKSVGDTNVILLDRNAQVIRRLDVNVGLDVETLRETLRQLLPNERLNVSAVGDSIFLSGSARSEATLTDARNIARRFVATDANIVNLARVGGEQQVLLRVRVAEVQKSALKELGFRLNAGPIHLGEFLFSWRSGTLSPQAFGGGTAVTEVNNTFTPGRTDILATAANAGGLPTAFSALETNGLVRTLAEPNLTAVSGETASMLAGGQFPIPVAAENGRITIDFKNFGVGLTFVPVVLDAGRISLKLATEVSAISPTVSVATGAGITVPGLTVRRASTTVEMPSGGAIMIAGLLQNEINSTINAFPGLQDLPVLGALFRSPSFQNRETELVVTISAYVVQPTNSAILALPTDGFAPANDLDRYLLGRLTADRRSELSEEARTGLLQGPVGYIVE